MGLGVAVVRGTRIFRLRTVPIREVVVAVVEDMTGIIAVVVVAQGL